MLLYKLGHLATEIVKKEVGDYDVGFDKEEV